MEFIYLFVGYLIMVMISISYPYYHYLQERKKQTVPDDGTIESFYNFLVLNGGDFFFWLSFIPAMNFITVLSSIICFTILPIGYYIFKKSWNVIKNIKIVKTN